MSLVSTVATLPFGRIDTRLTQAPLRVLSVAIANLFPAGSFDSATGFTLPAGCTISGGALNINVTANSTISYNLALAAGTYRFSYRVVSQSNGNVTPRMFAGTLQSGATVSHPIAPGVYSSDIVCASPVTVVDFRVTLSNSAGVMVLDDASIVRI